MSIVIRQAFNAFKKDVVPVRHILPRGRMPLRLALGTRANCVIVNTRQLPQLHANRPRLGLWDHGMNWQALFVRSYSTQPPPQSKPQPQTKQDENEKMSTNENSTNAANDKTNSTAAGAASKQKQNQEPSKGQESKESKESKESGSYTHWHRPTKEELLAAASGFFDRLRIRFKWLMIRQVRPFNMDDISAMFSWILVGNLIWILLGTTTFFSLVLLTLNTVFAQDLFARWVGNLVTKETGLTVVFENAIVPHWNAGVISLTNVFVSRRPNSSKSRHSRVQKGNRAIAAAAARASQDIGDDEVEGEGADDGNYTQFDVTIDSVSVTLSLKKWMDGKGILKDVEIKGVRGIIDRRHVHWDPDYVARDHKNVHKHGDFEIDSFKLEDMLVTVYQPGGVKPFDVSIFNCDLPQLRKHWLFYDILSANNMSGTYDNSLFTIHPRQMSSRAFASSEDGPSPWNKIIRFRIDSVDIRHLNHGVEGPFGWIESGNVDMLADIMLPSDTEQLKISEMVQDIVERWEANLTSRHRNSQDDKVVTTVEERAREREKHKYVLIDLRVQLNNTRASVPLFTPELSYINNALIRPIVAYINSRDTYIPINCRVVKRLTDFEGSWTIYDSELMDDISAEVYEAFARNVADDEARALRVKKVGFWSIQFAAQLLLLSLGALA